jgi:hypothetical protein
MNTPQSSEVSGFRAATRKTVAVAITILSAIAAFAIAGEPPDDAALPVASHEDTHCETYQIWNCLGPNDKSASTWSAPLP